MKTKTRILKLNKRKLSRKVKINRVHTLGSIALSHFHQRQDAIALRTLRKLTVKSLALFMAASLSLAPMLHTEYTLAYYNDTERSAGNFFGAVSLDFSLESTLEVPEGEELLRTQTQGGWGQGAAGDNVGVYRDANFASTFPQGVLIGTEEGFHAIFLSAQAVEDFLPAGGKPSIFSNNHIDPESTEAGNLAGQLLALSLNIGFDDFDPDFAPSTERLGDWELPGSLCEGMTADEVLLEGNTLISGGSSTFTPSEISGCADFINNAFLPEKASTESSENETATSTISIFNHGILGFKYQIYASTTDATCDPLLANASLDGSEKYNGALASFASGPLVFEDPDNWEITIAQLGSLPEGDSCDLDIVVHGWQDDLDNPGGYIDTETVSLSLTSNAAPNSLEEEVFTMELFNFSMFSLMVEEEASTSTATTTEEAVVEEAVATTTATSTEEVGAEEATSTPETSEPELVEKTLVEDPPLPKTEEGEAIREEEEEVEEYLEVIEPIEPEDEPEALPEEQALPAQE